MDADLLNDGARLVHLLGLSLGLAIALLAGASAARAVLRPLHEREVEILQTLHHFVTLGLVLLWASGLTLLWLRTGFEVEQFSPKLWAKLCVVMILTVSAIAIGRIGLPTLLRFQSWWFGDIPLPTRVQLCALGVLSAACWLSALALVVFGYFKTLNADQLTHILAVTLIAALFLALLAATVTPLIAFLVRLKKRRSAAQG